MTCGFECLSEPSYNFSSAFGSKDQSHNLRGASERALIIFQDSSCGMKLLGAGPGVRTEPTGQGYEGQGEGYKAGNLAEAIKCPCFSL